MKKGFSILFAAVILLSGMHLSLATHTCSGELAAVKWSFADEKASCGMAVDKPVNATANTITAESCCKDEMSFFAVDSNYNPSSLQVNEPVKQLLQVFYIPATLGIQLNHTNSGLNAHVQPPGNYIARAVNLPDICVFRI